MEHDTIAVVDFGGQYAHLIATKIRRLHVLAEILQPEADVGRFIGYKGIILSGSPSLSSYDEEGDYDKAIFDLPIPILGLCFGHQEIAKHYGGKVEHTRREYGPATLELRGDCPIFKGLARRETVWMSHGDAVTLCPEGFQEVGVSLRNGGVHPNAAIANNLLGRYGFQFHPEVDNTVHGEEMLKNFVINICGCRQDWTIGEFLEEATERLKEQARGRDVFLLVSGGVDSTVCAVLLGRVLGAERVHLLHVDNGLMRKGESEAVAAELRGRGLGKNFHFVDGSERFLTALGGVVDPEKKRAIIGNTFLEIFQEEAARLKLEDCLLAQGTIYPDTIETGGTKRADVIKTHHNRVPAIRKMVEAGLVVEPLANLYKVEVRELGEELGLPEDLVWRHPFPGPGLAIRLLCSSGEAPRTEARAAETLEKLVAEVGVDGKLLPVRSVGVKADLRCYERPVMLWGDVSLERFEKLAARIFQEVPGVNRCVVDIGGKGCKETKPLAATVTKERLALLREADAIVMEALRRHGLYRSVWQCPTVLVPLEIDGRGKELVVIRPVSSKRAMTAMVFPLPPQLLSELREKIMALGDISGIVLDVTTKPPGTIEWE